MPRQIEQRVTCPYCGEPQTILIDPSVMQQSYIEDCQVCCRPIEFQVEVSADGEDVSIMTMTDNE
ncbi:CPXCG motif-containing cysteine-rich protein [Kangiella sp.]|uniref:CPXCG motif-containing cysteine-rich protein n=1 Tax=Kangiella sp. TaxID=1920245 RepID=UPI0019B00669|nr:CPXCG motif-containing cysteine-rich protein [Kangiella sp.]MBD3654572.1 CPXCG motif-containing cysteine-rich protein [Kangiella sp.]